jgi:glycosyltransferase involved in cell wall biosynthesis
MAHALPPEEQSGSPLLAAGYAAELGKRDWDVTVLYASEKMPSWDGVQPQRRAGELFTRVAVPPTTFRHAVWSVCEPSVHGYVPSLPSAALEKVLDQTQPDIAHVVDNVNLPLDWPERMAARSIPVVRTVSCAEDLCGLIAPVSAVSDPVGYCLAPLTPQRCAQCIASTMDMVKFRRAMGCDTTRGAASTHQSDAAMLTDLLDRKRARAVMQYSSSFTRVIFSSRAFRAYFEQSMLLDPARVAIIPIGIDALAGQAGSGGRTSSGEAVVFGYAGSLDRVKGIECLASTFLDPSLLTRDDYRLVILGDGERSLIAKLLKQNPNVQWHGAYQPDELPGLLSQIDVGLSTSRFETFHRVTREFLLSGIPVIGSTAFGIPEVVRHGRNGLLFDHAEPGSLLRAVTSCLDDPELVARLREGAAATPVRSVGQEVDDLVALYEECL